MARAAFILGVFPALLLGCHRGPELLGQIQAAGGSKVVREEVSSLLRDYEQTGRASWGDVTKLPDHVASFSEGARIVRDGDIRIMDLSVPDRHRHHGLLVILDPLPERYIVKFGKCRVWKIADGIYEYRE